MQKSLCILKIYHDVSRNIRDLSSSQQRVTSTYIKHTFISWFQYSWKNVTKHNELRKELQAKEASTRLEKPPSLELSNAVDAALLKINTRESLVFTVAKLCVLYVYDALVWSPRFLSLGFLRNVNSCVTAILGLWDPALFVIHRGN